MSAGRRESASFASIAPVLVLALFALLVAGLLFAIAGGSRYATNDEAVFILLGRSLASDPLSALTVQTGRGPERGMALLAMGAALLTRSATGQLEVLHLMMALAQALIVVPVYLASRILDLSRWQSALVAGVAAAGSFASYGAFALNTTLGVLAVALLLWASLRDVARPGPLGDALVIGSVALVAVARVGWLPLAAAAIPAIMAGAYISTGGDWKTRLRELPGVLWRRHRVLVAVVALLAVGAIAALLAGRLGSGYGTQILGQEMEVGQAWRNLGLVVGRVAVGVAVLPMIFALPLVARNLFSPNSPEAGAVAWFTSVLFVVFLYVHYAATNEDRYLAVLVPLVAVNAGIALFKRPPLPVLAVAGSGIVVALAVRSGYVSFPDGGDPYSYFVSPTSTFLSRALFQRFTTYVPLGETQVEAAFLILCVVVAVALAAFLRHPGVFPVPRALAASMATVLVLGALAYQLIAMTYPVKKYVGILGMKASPERNVSFIDRSSSAPGFTTRVLAPNGSFPPDLFAELPRLSVLNEKLGGGLTAGVFSETGGSQFEVSIDPASGSATPVGAPPRQLLYRRGYVPVDFAGAELPVPPEFAFAGLKRLASPLRANWVITGTGAAGYATPSRLVRLRVYPGDRKSCVSGNVLIDPRLLRPLAAVLVTPSGRQRLRVVPGAPTPFRSEVGPGRSDVLLYSQTGNIAGERVGAGFFDLQLGPCDAAR